MEEWINLRVVYGPIGRKVDDLITVMKVLFNRERYENLPAKVKDPYYLPNPFDENILNSKKRLRIGFVKSFDIVPSCVAN